jgi:hypothetical protein
MNERILAEQVGQQIEAMDTCLRPELSIRTDSFSILRGVLVENLSTPLN